jgi:hypothetical protein
MSREIRTLRNVRYIRCGVAEVQRVGSNFIQGDVL